MSLTYAEAEKLFESARDPDAGKPLAHNTRLERSWERTVGVESVAVYHVRLHTTRVVSIHPDHYVLRTGGWETMTTRNRIHRFSPARIETVRGRGWYVVAHGNPNPYPCRKVVRPHGRRPDPPADADRWVRYVAESVNDEYEREIARYGNMEAWKAAYEQDKIDFLARRKAHNEWKANNRAPLGAELPVDLDGNPLSYALFTERQRLADERAERERERRVRKLATRGRRRAVLAWRKLGHDVPGRPDANNGGIEYLCVNGITPLDFFDADDPRLAA